MKVTGPNATPGSGQVRRSDKPGSSGGGGFAKALGSVEEGEAAQGPARTSSVSMVDALLAVQEVDPDGQARGRARKRGERLLDRLDELRRALLLGDLSVADLDKLTQAIAEEREMTTDPQLNEILDEIDLRAQVERAKYEQD